MAQLLLLLVLFVTVGMATRSGYEDDSVFVDHHNLGYSLRRTAQAAIITNYGRMLFHFAIPRQHPLIPFQRIRCTQINATNDGNNDCHRLQTIQMSR